MVYALIAVGCVTAVLAMTAAVARFGRRVPPTPRRDDSDWPRWEHELEKH